jgi:serine-type D-Ala-D-Ala carboxypeptidase
MNALEKKLKNLIDKETGGDLPSYTPSLDIEVYSKGRKAAKLHMGKPAKYYDLASLTKILFSVSEFIQLVDQRKINLGDGVYQYLPWWPYKHVTIADVLSHSAGLGWWAPFYKLIGHKKAAGKIQPRLKEAQAREVVRKFLSKLKLNKDKKAVYSDLDFLLLGFLIEAVTNKSLLDAWLALNKKLKLKSLHFNFGNKPKYPRQQYAPTENCPWRKKVLQGEVHDDNTWSWGGVSSHAGLFGRIEDVSKWGLLLRKAYFSKNGSALGSHKTVRLFTKRAIPASRGDWALGLTLPSKKDSTSGKRFSKNSVGHTGFTGTSLWFDPERDLLVVICSNRVHPTRDNTKFRSLRPRIHDFIVQSL